jgi:hypothetical protein
MAEFQQQICIRLFRFYLIRNQSLRIIINSVDGVNLFEYTKLFGHWMYSLLKKIDFSRQVGKIQAG